jgi:hypothetical protein
VSPPTRGDDAVAKGAAARAPSAAQARAEAALQAAVARHLAEANLSESLSPYTLSPSLVQLRRYVERGGKEYQLVCVVDLALSDAQGTVVASVRGNTAARGASYREAIDAAAGAAVSRLPEALQALQGVRKSRQVAAR